MQDDALLALILDLLAGGWTVAEILAQYPGIEERDVRACLAYAAERALGRLP